MYLLIWLICAISLAFTIHLPLRAGYGGKPLEMVSLLCALILSGFFLAAITYTHPLFYIHKYVWMGPSYVMAINFIVGAVTIFILTILFYFIFDKR